MLLAQNIWTDGGVKTKKGKERARLVRPMRVARLFLHNVADFYLRIMEQELAAEVSPPK